MGKRIKKEDEIMHDRVMALTDFEICQHLAEIEGLNTYAQFDSIRVQVTDGDDYYFNPLADSSQLVALIEKHDVLRNYEEYDAIGFSYHVMGGDNCIRVTEVQDFEGSGEPDISMAKAICLAIILNKDAAFSLTPRPKGEKERAIDLKLNKS